MTRPHDKIVPLRATEDRNRCPECKRPTIEEFKPFCSKRCANVDLGRWFTESYTVAGRPLGDEDD